MRSAYGAVLPDYDTVIFDEAHLLEEVATAYFGVQASSWQIEEIAREAEGLAARAARPARGAGGSAALRHAADELFLPLRERLRGRQGRQSFEPQQRGGPDLEAQWAVLSEALDDVSRQAADLQVEQDRIESLTRRVEETRRALIHVLERCESAFVYGMELRGRDTVILTASPIDVSELLRRELFERLHACVLTSATLSVQGKFDFFLPRLGLDDAETMIVDQAFDHRRQAVLYLPRRMPEPRDPAYVERAVEEIVRLTGITDGRAFLLFTSYANMQRIHEALDDLDRWPLFVQGQGSKAALVDSFRQTPRAVLLGTTSFWHGVDVPGEALSLVIVDKLPFDVPSDPLIAARIERIREAEGNPFMQYQVPLAVLELKQGLGRLLRRSTDRGILSVLDARLTTKRYGRTFLGSLPSYRVVRDLEECKRFFHGPEQVGERSGTDER